MSTQSAVQQQLAFWHGVAGPILGDCSPDVLNKGLPQATITSIGSIYAHIVWAEDAIVHGMLQGKPAMYQSDGWEAKTGIPFPGMPPSMNPDWAREFTMDVGKFGEYAKAMFAASEAYVGGLPDGELSRKVQTPIGEQTVEWALVTLLATHLPQHLGEIAALKGVHGLKGLPF
jgi:hypothetical protein